LADQGETRRLNRAALRNVQSARALQYGWMGYNREMTAEECHERATECAANASLAVSEPIAAEFMKLAAKWRAMATRAILLESIDHAMDAAGVTYPTDASAALI